MTIPWLLLATFVVSVPEAPQFGLVEQSFEHTGDYENPYRQLSATVRLTEPDNKTHRDLPLFWDGARSWRFRFSPDKTGLWKWATQSDNDGLHGKTGEFRVVASNLAGGLQPMPHASRHFQRQNGTAFWFLGDTAWALFTDHDEEKHDRAALENYLRRRAVQGFNVVHSMLLSEAGWGNSGGAPFTSMADQRINPTYWQEVDRRIQFANAQDIVAGLALAWGNKRNVEPYAWSRFPSREAQLRYARYIAARYSALDVYFLVSGEWHAEIGKAQRSHDHVRADFIALGEHLAANDPHGRMIGIHPMTDEGSVREFASESWMSFADYQQNYQQLHQRVLLSRPLNKPVVNAEYAYFLRDQNGDGKTDKPNSATIDAIRHATWDIVMGGGYVVTGFGSTYFGGNRHPGPFHADDPRNAPWEHQAQYLRTLFTSVEWWNLAPHDELIASAAARTEDRSEHGVLAPPQVAYWLLADPGKTYLAYVRGRKGAYKLTLAKGEKVRYRLRQFDPRTGSFADMGMHSGGGSIFYSAPDQQDWVLVATAVAP